MRLVNDADHLKRQMNTADNMPAVLLIATFDTKAEEALYLQRKMESLGCRVLSMDTGILEESGTVTDINLQRHYALDIPGESDEAKYLCTKTLWTLRHIVAEKGLDRELFNATTETLAKVFGVDVSKQRIDSVHIRSNMRHLGRICIFSQSIHNFLVNLKRQRRAIFETIEKELVERYLTEKALVG